LSAKLKEIQQNLGYKKMFQDNCNAVMLSFKRRRSRSVVNRCDTMSDVTALHLAQKIRFREVRLIKRQPLRISETYRDLTDTAYQHNLFHFAFDNFDE